MGASFTSIVLQGPTQEDVAAALRADRRSAFVSPTTAGRTVVFDEASERQDESLPTLAVELSKRFRCAALAVLVHDSDVLLLNLFESGRERDGYNSAPTYFDADGDPDELPEGGDAELLCRAFGTTDSAGLERILRAVSGTEFVFEEQRLAAIVLALGLPQFVAELGFSALRDAELQPSLDVGVDIASMVRTP